MGVSSETEDDSEAFGERMKEIGEELKELRRNANELGEIIDSYLARAVEG